jgi:chromosome segregation ATPase
LSTELIVSILGFLAASAGVAQWLIKVYWSQAEKIEDLRSKNEKRTIFSLESTVDDLKKEIRSHKAELSKLNGSLLDVQARIQKNTDDGQALMKALYDYVDTTAAKFEKLEGVMIALSKDLILVKGRKNGKTN